MLGCALSDIFDILYSIRYLKFLAFLIEKNSALVAQRHAAFLDVFMNFWQSPPFIDIPLGRRSLVSKTLVTCCKFLREWNRFLITSRRPGDRKIIHSSVFAATPDAEIFCIIGDFLLFQALFCKKSCNAYFCIADEGITTLHVEFAALPR